MIKLLKNNVKCQGHLKVKVIMPHVCEKGLDLSNNLCECEVNRYAARPDVFPKL